MDKLQNELQELQNLAELDEAQKSRLAELPFLIAEAEKTALQELLEKTNKDLESALAQKEHFRKKAESKPDYSQAPSVEVIDLVKVGKKLQAYSDEELDFITKHAGSKNPEEILKTAEDPFVKAGIEATRLRVEKERQALTPSNNQDLSDKPKSLADSLKGKSFSEQEELLIKAGLYKLPGKGRGR